MQSRAITTTSWVRGQTARSLRDADQRPGSRLGSSRAGIRTLHGTQSTFLTPVCPVLVGSECVTLARLFHCGWGLPETGGVRRLQQHLLYSQRCQPCRAETLVARVLVFSLIEDAGAYRCLGGVKWPQGERYNRFQRPRAAPPPVHLADPACLTPRTSHSTPHPSPHPTPQPLSLLC